MNRASSAPGAPPTRFLHPDQAFWLHGMGARFPTNPVNYPFTPTASAKETDHGP